MPEQKANCSPNGNITVDSMIMSLGSS
ncbi:uncharacterized protein YNL040C-A [Saccharomyces cerevisiae S288C]|uniref:Uncharacterized protein YNL040C-A n=1 Tax=Saccharomyces cerevisiae (strain ATCC 204508 / S288c) TaxID=559292 RepID=YN040_YEAST